MPPRKRVPKKHRFSINQRPHWDGVMISVLVYSVKSWSGKIKDYKMSICCCYANLGCSCITLRQPCNNQRPRCDIA